MAATRDKKVRGFVGTAYGDLQEVGAKLQNLLESDSCIYGAYQTEKCPTTGREHIQWYLEFKNARSLRKMRTTFGHCEVRKGSMRKAFDYCQKEDSRVVGPSGSKGDPPAESQQGKRNDWDAVKEYFKHGGSIDGVLHELDMPGMYARHPTALQRLWFAMNEKKERQIEVLYIWGPTATGKSFWANKNYPNAYRLDMLPPSGVPWWDLYAGQDVVIIDDFRDTSIKFDQMLRILDRYPLILPVKGSSAKANYQTVIITSNQDPQMCYLNELDNAPFLRRITKTIHMPFRYPLLPEGNPTPTPPLWEQLAEMIDQVGESQPVRRL